MATYNEKPRPRVLFEDVSDGLFHELSALVPTSRRISSDEDVHETEFDLLVTQAEDASMRRQHLHVLSFGASRLDSLPSNAESSSAFGTNYPHRYDQTLADEAHIPNDVAGPLRQLLERTVVATIPSTKRSVWFIPWRGKDRATVLVELGPEKLPYSILWMRQVNEQQVWSLALPDETTERKEWFLWLLRELHNVDSQSFPGEEEWATSPAWATANTFLLHEQLDESIESYRAVLAESAAKERTTRAALDIAVQEDATGLHRLLTADGEALEAAVVVALTALGFIAVQMDDHHDAVTKAKLEDLRVTDPAEPGWVSLVEIKGYTKGAKTNDINQITGKPLISYVIETKQRPSALWHIVNVKRATAPGTRGSAVPNDLDLAHLESVDGVLIDTRQLFLAVRDVQLGARDAVDVRASLRESRMRWEYRTGAV